MQYHGDMQGLLGVTLSSQCHHAVCRPWMLSKDLIAYTFWIHTFHKINEAN